MILSRSNLDTQMEIIYMYVGLYQTIYNTNLSAMRTKKFDLTNIMVPRGQIFGSSSCKWDCSVNIYFRAYWHTLKWSENKPARIRSIGIYDSVVYAIARHCCISRKACVSVWKISKSKNIYIRRYRKF